MRAHSVPHDDVHISAESVVDVLCHIQIHKVTEMMEHVHSYNTQLHIIVSQ